MKILLINCPIRLNAKPNNIPYGLATIAATLLRHGHQVEIFDINALRHDKKTVARALARKEWDLAGVSGLVTTIAYQVWLIPELKRLNPHAPVVSGGGLATSNSDLLFKLSDVDLTVRGEGEATMVELCQALEKGLPPEQVPGVCARHGGSHTCGPARSNIADLDNLPFPAWDLLPMEIYLKNPIWGDVAANSSGFLKDVNVDRSMNIITSRGCPFACEYCYHLFGRSSYRFRSPANIVAEMETLVERYEVNFFGFVDDNTMASKSHLLEFCGLLEKKKLPVTWGCHGRVTSAEPEILARMAGAGCVWIGYGIESGSQRILDAMNKKAKVEKAKQAVRETRKAGIFPNTTFIFGYPGEDLESIQASIDFKKELEIECPSFFATPYPGTPLFDQVRHRIEDEEAFILSLDNATEFSINLTDFDQAELFRLKACMDANQDVLPGR